MIDAIDGLERIRYTSPHPKDIREDVIRAHAELPSVCEHIHLPLQSGSSPRAQGDAPHLQPRALPRPRGDDPRAGAGLRAHHRHHRRLPGRDRRRLRGDDGGGRAGALRLRLHVHLLARGAGRWPPSSTASCRTTSSASAWSGWWRRCSGTRPSARSASWAGRWRCSWRARRARTRPSCAAASATTRRSTSPALAAPGELTEVEVDLGDEHDAGGRGAPAGAARASGRALAAPARAAGRPARPSRRARRRRPTRALRPRRVRLPST